MTGEGGGSRRIGAAGRSGGAESRRRSGTCPVCGAKLRNPPRFRRRSPAFFASASGGPLCSVAFVPTAPREVEKLRVFRLRPPVFSSFARAFFVRRPGRPLRGVKCAVPRACVTRTRQPLFVFSLHRFTHPAQCADTQDVEGEYLTPFFLHPCLPHSHPVRDAPIEG